MQTITSIPANALPPDELASLLSESVALDRTRVVRRLLVGRCILLAAVVALFESLVPGFSRVARVLSTALCLVPAAWARMAELRLDRRLSGRLERIDRPTSVWPGE